MSCYLEFKMFFFEYIFNFYRRMIRNHNNMLLMTVLQLWILKFGLLRGKKKC